ncbi:hypothetical protein ACKFKG_26900 [Phormidesmis sp. 146-35]
MSSIWKTTIEASELLGLSPRQLRKLRVQVLNPKHYRLKNPTASRPEYLWNVRAIALLLSPNDD